MPVVKQPKRPLHAGRIKIPAQISSTVTLLGEHPRKPAERQEQQRRLCASGNFGQANIALLLRQIVLIDELERSPHWSSQNHPDRDTRRRRRLYRINDIIFLHQSAGLLVNFLHPAGPIARRYPQPGLSARSDPAPRSSSIPAEPSHWEHPIAGPSQIRWSRPRPASVISRGSLQRALAARKLI